ncbi:hypothetical protein B0H17DRAFT_1154177 [Mycena rosella]|uniref:Uncharacterized protein n=1 Tax=Mycena rosella TaxID=1033263 RepID=A0AAD7AZR6_MYCRO|nr:hypothetical protein B0H17DRAFT_1154177 [Mycena rosella]
MHPGAVSPGPSHIPMGPLSGADPGQLQTIKLPQAKTTMVTVLGWTRENKPTAVIGKRKGKNFDDKCQDVIWIITAQKESRHQRQKHGYGTPQYSYDDSQTKIAPMHHTVFSAIHVDELPALKGTEQDPRVQHSACEHILLHIQKILPLNVNRQNCSKSMQTDPKLNQSQEVHIGAGFEVSVWCTSTCSKHRLKVAILVNRRSSGKFGAAKVG